MTTNTKGAYKNSDAGDLAESLVQRINTGDRRAEEELVAHYHRGLLFVLRKECGDSQLAEDLTQDTFVKVINNAREGKIQEPRALAWYIRRMGVYQLIDLRRKEGRRKTTPSADIEQHGVAESASVTDIVDGQQAGHLVRRLLEGMSVERDRELLRRFYLIGQDKSVIASEFGITLAHFDRVKSRALQRLKKLTTEYLDERGAKRSDLLSLLLMAAFIAAAGGAATDVSADDGPVNFVEGDVGEIDRWVHFSNSTLGNVCPTGYRAQEEYIS